MDDELRQPHHRIEDDVRFATTLARGLSILRAFRPGDEGLTNAELSVRTGLPKATVSRLTWTLGALGYLTRPARAEKYRIGPSLMALGHVATASMNFLELMHGPLQDLANETASLMCLNMRDRSKVLLTRTWRPRNVASLWLEAGQRVPLGTSSSGWALIAAMSPQEIEWLLADQPENGLTASDVARIREAALEQIERTSCVIIPHELSYSANANVVSVPIRVDTVAEPLVLTAGGSPDVLSQDRMRDELGPRLVETIRRLQAASGGAISLIPKEGTT